MQEVPTHIDRNLFQRVAEGEEQAFELLFNASLATLHPFLKSMVKTEDAVHEVLQETFIRVWLGREKLTGIENPRAWLFRVVSNECYTYLKKKARAGVLLLAQLPDDVADPDMPAGKPELEELKKIIADAIDRLPAQRRRIYELSRNEGLKIPEIANRLNLSPSTVKNALVLALKSIREQLAENGYQLPAVLVLLLHK